jgi:hypothetical protein
MKTLKQEISKFIESIGQKEIKTNPKLQRKLIALLKKLEELNDYPEAGSSKHRGVLKYLNEKMLR